MSFPKIIHLYRITHLNNLDFILKLGLITCPSHPNCDVNYTGIGDSTLIKSRNLKEIPIGSKGNFTDYVSFYFGARSPMLYSIQKGYNGVTKRHPDDIIYLVSNFPKIRSSNRHFVFTDGHGYHSFSEFFNSENDFDKVDWETVNLVKWNDTEEDPDRKRRKQSEFLVHKEVTVKDLCAIATYSENSKRKVENLLEKYSVKLEVIIQPKSMFKN